MSHFAEIDENNTVLRVLVMDNDLPNEGYDWLIENLGGTWVQTSYNANFRKHFAGVGFTYDSERDVFIPPKPFDSWLLNNDTLTWEAPVPYPQTNEMYQWNESILNWETVETEER